MKSSTITAAAAALFLAAPALFAASPAAAEAPAAARPFIAADFPVPSRIEGKGFQLVPLGPALVKIDFDAYMSSIEHLQKTFTRSAAWPHPGITDADAMADMQAEAARFAGRESFAYSVLTPDGTRERGCVYISPSPVPGYDAVVRIWVTKAEYDAGFDRELTAWATRWVETAWPFRKVAYPGRTIDWQTWDALTAANPAK